MRRAKELKLPDHLVVRREMFLGGLVSGGVKRKATPEERTLKKEEGKGNGTHFETRGKKRKPYSLDSRRERGYAG